MGISRRKMSVNRVWYLPRTVDNLLLIILVLVIIILAVSFLAVGQQIGRKTLQGNNADANEIVREVPVITQ